MLLVSDSIYQWTAYHSVKAQHLLLPELYPNPGIAIFLGVSIFQVLLKSLKHPVLLLPVLWAKIHDFIELCSSDCEFLKKQVTSEIMSNYPKFLSLNFRLRPSAKNLALPEVQTCLPMANIRDVPFNPNHSMILLFPSFSSYSSLLHSFTVWALNFHLLHQQKWLSSANSLEAYT